MAFLMEDILEAPLDTLEEVDSLVGPLDTLEEELEVDTLEELAVDISKLRGLMMDMLAEQKML